MALGTATASATNPAPYGPRLDCGRLCLDLLATAHPDEQLRSVDRLWTWIVAAGLVPEGTPLPGADLAWLAGFRELRGSIAQLVRTAAGDAGFDRRQDAALGKVNETARAATSAPRAVRTEEGALVRALDGAPACAALLAVVARDAVELLTDPAACAALRQCAGDNCAIVYLDTSRGRRRRWCSSETCGNRERVARHRRRAALARA